MKTISSKIDVFFGVKRTKFEISARLMKCQNFHEIQYIMQNCFNRKIKCARYLIGVIEFCMVVLGRSNFR